MEKMPPGTAELMSLQGFKENPEDFYRHFRPYLEMVLSAKPNAAHTALAELEAGGYLQAIITMNGDMLHRKAGSRNVVEMHGTIERAVCTQCYQPDEGADHWRRYLEDGKIPRCGRCGGVMKPDVILPGEQLPAQMVLKAKKLLRDCEAILAAGTSFSGGLVMNWIEQAVERGKKMMIVNLHPTILDSAAEIVIRGDVAEVLPALQEAVSRKR